MALTVYHYPNCGTCKKALKWLDSNNIEYHTVHIVERPPSKLELENLVNNSELPVKKFFNTSGKKYRELELKDQLPNMSDEEQLELLSTNGMLIKRPVVTDGKKVTVGFKEDEFVDTWK
ncbi:arsenate reductase family protein [Halalkalibacillus halophilus]|uniref:arsenate reductase family protein n=1 Tax=Halalkalibacillus halophilus TaxID=392827 RepID=UPI0003F654DA|nr:arsenate reductase family protein [Halalkalibacillus halophilus]